MQNLTYSQSHQIYACLPFIELAHETSIPMGPLIFWPASKYEDFIPPEAHSSFHRYIQSIGQIKARCKDEKNSFINTIKLEPQATTCISINEKIEPSLREFLLIDALYLLYFACTFRNLYYSQELLPFDAFRKMIPASLDFIQHPENWKHLHIDETRREDTVCIHLFDQEICQALGKTLMAVYTQNAVENLSLSTLNSYKRLIRSIRYLIDRFFQRFVNLLPIGLNLSEELFEPEDVIFLASSFEALFDIDDRHVQADFKQKLRPLLHLKYSKPVELFWKWVDDFYEVRRKIVHGGSMPDPFFRINPNFEVSHILIGMKLFIYSVYYYLFKYHLIYSEAFDVYTPPDFKWIHPEEVLLFFWTEESLLRKLHAFMKQAKETPHQEELYADIHLLANLFIFMQEHYHLSKAPINGIKFIPTPLKDIQAYSEEILEMVQIENLQEPKSSALLKHLPPEFTVYLMKRIA